MREFGGLCVWECVCGEGGGKVRASKWVRIRRGRKVRNTRDKETFYEVALKKILDGTIRQLFINQ